MSNILGTFVLKLIILLAKFAPFKFFDQLCASVDFLVISKWSFLANFASAPTFKWWNTVVSMDFRFP
jgi:hypothetical protein